MPWQRPSETFFRVQREEKPWGHELLWAWADRYVGKVLHVRAGESLSLQFHRAKDETISVLSGRVRVEHGDDEAALASHTLGVGDCFHVTPGTRHRVTAIEDAQLLEASTPELDDVVRLEDRYGRADGGGEPAR